MTLPGGQKVYKMKRNAGRDGANHEDENTCLKQNNKTNNKTKTTQFPQKPPLCFSCAEFVPNNQTHKAGKHAATPSKRRQLSKGHVRTWRNDL